MKKYLTNVRIIKGSNTGISRYVNNLLPYLNNLVIEKFPQSHFFYSGILGHIWDIFSFIKHRNEDVWLTSHRGSPFLNNYIITIHDLQPIISRSSFSFFYSFFYKYLIKLHINKSKHILTVSEKVKLDIIKYYNVSPQKITVAYPGHEHLKKISLNKCSNLLEYEYAIMYGNISPVKKSLSNIKAWISINNNNNLRLLIIGNLDKSIATEFYEIIKNNNKLIYLKYVDDLVLFNYLRNSTYLYFNSPNEGFGIPALEAVYFRIPVLYSSHSSVSEFILNYGVSVVHDDYQSLCKGLNKILHINVNSYEYEVLRLKILHNCSWSKSAKIILDVLNTH